MRERGTGHGPERSGRWEKEACRTGWGPLAGASPAPAFPRSWMLEGAVGAYARESKRIMAGK